jgi:hypothetical protein
VNDDDVFSVNDAFRSKLIKVKIGTVSSHTPPSPVSLHTLVSSHCVSLTSGEQQSVAAPQNARGWNHPPCSHFNIQPCFRLGSAFEVAAFQTQLIPWLDTMWPTGHSLTELLHVGL